MFVVKNASASLSYVHFISVDRSVKSQLRALITTVELVIANLYYCLMIESHT